MNNFVGFFVNSPIIAQLSVFNSGAWNIGAGTASSAMLTGAPVGANAQDGAIQAFLTAAITSGDVPAVTPNSLYIFFLPDGTTVSHPTLGDSCNQHCGYHSNASGTPYVVMPYLGCTYCQPTGTSVTDSMTAALSHEMCEAITDPLGNAWYADNANQDEIADLCNDNGWSTKRVGGFLVQQFCLPTGTCW
jgi:hypothetical protein